MFKRVFECVRFKASRVMKTKNIFGRKKGNQRKKKPQRERGKQQNKCKCKIQRTQEKYK